MGIGVKWITPVEVTPSTPNAWVDVDVSSYIPEGSTGVMLHCVNNSGNDYSFGLRKNGSTDYTYSTVAKSSHFWAAIGVDSSRIFEAYVGSTTGIDIYLVGYFQAESVFFTNAINKSPSQLGYWVDINISSDTGDDTAIGAIFLLLSSLPTSYGLRKNGSTDNRYSSMGFAGFVVGVDSSEICEGYKESILTNFMLVGYIKDYCVLNTNATNVSLSIINSWVDLPSSLPSGAMGGFIEVHPTSTSYTYGLRKDGSSENIIYCPYHPMGMVECNPSGIIEGRISSTDIDFFLIGYSKPPHSIDKYDSIQITETIIALLPILSVYIFDSTSPSDIITTNLTFSISLFDSSSLSDQLTLEIITGNYFVDTSDSTSLTETLILSLSNNISLHDSTTITELTTTHIPTYLFSTYDTISTTELTVAFLPFTSISVFDSSSILELTSTFLPFLSTYTYDATTTEDSPSLLLPTYSISIFDVASTVDSPSLLLPFTSLSVFDSLTTSDLPSFLLPSMSIDTYDSTTTLDLPTLQLPTYFISLFDSTTTSEHISFTLILTHYIATYDQTLTTDFPSLFLPYNALSTYDSTTITETTTTSQTFYTTVHDATTTSDFPLLSLPLTINLLDTISTTDLPSTSTLLSLSLFDETFLSDVPTITTPFLNLTTHDTLLTTDFSTLSLTPYLLFSSDNITTTEHLLTAIRITTTIYTFSRIFLSDVPTPLIVVRQLFPYATDVAYLHSTPIVSIFDSTQPSTTHDTLLVAEQVSLALFTGSYHITTHDTLTTLDLPTTILYSRLLPSTTYDSLTISEHSSLLLRQWKLFISTTDVIKTSDLTPVSRKALLKEMSFSLLKPCTTSKLLKPTTHSKLSKPNAYSSFSKPYVHTKLNTPYVRFRLNKEF
ncbi:MAG: hypothetical protein QXQ53_01180 [Candidatus Methanosuratincola sp.]